MMVHTAVYGNLHTIAKCQQVLLLQLLLAHLLVVLIVPTAAPHDVYGPHRQ